MKSTILDPKANFVNQLAEKKWQNLKK